MTGLDGDLARPNRPFWDSSSPGGGPPIVRALALGLPGTEVVRTVQRVLLTNVARVGHYVVPAIEKQVGQCGTDSLRRARHDGGLAFRSHVKLLIENCACTLIT